MKAEALPALPTLGEWGDTLATLHMWSQIVGKIRLARTPLVNHYWNVPLYVTERGLTTSILPHERRNFVINFEFADEHRLVIETDDGAARSIGLRPRSVADFYRAVTTALGELGLETKIWTTPVEVPDPIPFERDETHHSYDAEQVRKFWRALVWVDEVFKEFRADFVGKCSPVHFFWGSFDLAVTRFNGERAPERAGADAITREAYSHKVISHGFWGGGGPVREAAFYAYAAPEPDGFARAEVSPAAAYYHQELKEYVLPYDAVRRADSPKEALLDFMRSTYEAGADLAGWDRAALERR